MINRREVFGLGVAIGRTPESHAAYKASIRARYEKYGDDVPCPFCKGHEGGLQDHEILDEHKGVYIVRNAFPYVIDNGQEVLSHELVIPHMHASDVDDMPSEQAKAFTDAITYLRVNMGRTVMMRSNKDVTKSIPHAHAHGFTYGRRAIFQFYNPNNGENEVLFEGDEDKITDALGRLGLFYASAETLGDLV